MRLEFELDTDIQVWVLYPATALLFQSRHKAIHIAFLCFDVSLSLYHK